MYTTLTSLQFYILGAIVALFFTVWRVPAIAKKVTDDSIPGIFVALFLTVLSWLTVIVIGVGMLLRLWQLTHIRWLEYRIQRTIIKLAKLQKANPEKLAYMEKQKDDMQKVAGNHSATLQLLKTKLIERLTKDTNVFDDSEVLDVIKEYCKEALKITFTTPEETLNNMSDHEFAAFSMFIEHLLNSYGVKFKRK